jgi:hypothetical protein
MKKLLLTSALVAALCAPALAHKHDGKGDGHTRGAPAPAAGGGLTGIAVILGGLGIYWVVSRRQRRNSAAPGR